MTPSAAPMAAATDPRPPAVRLAFIVGPTGSGKSALAIALAERLGAEIVNADSRQLYRGMSLGTAAPSPLELSRVSHHLVGIQPPDQPLDVAGFARLARAAIAEIAGRGRTVLIVGGSGLYLRALRDGIFPGPPASAPLRANLVAFARHHGSAALHQQLAAVDPLAAARLSPNDLQRIVRALEVERLTGIPLSEHHARHRFAESPWPSITIGLTMPRELLYAAIDRRLERMMEAGLVEEVGALISRFGGNFSPLLATIGYREIAAYLRGECGLATALERAKRASRRLAKRQLTWFRADPKIAWVDARAPFMPACTLLDDFLRGRERSSDGR